VPSGCAGPGRGARRRGARTGGLASSSPRSPRGQLTADGRAGVHSCRVQVQGAFRGAACRRRRGPHPESRVAGDAGRSPGGRRARGSAGALFAACDALSTETYERTETNGTLLLCGRGHPSVEVLLEMTEPAPLRSTRAARKLLQMGRAGVEPLSDVSTIWGLGRIVSPPSDRAKTCSRCDSRAARAGSSGRGASASSWSRTAGTAGRCSRTRRSRAIGSRRSCATYSPGTTTLTSPECGRPCLPCSPRAAASPSSSRRARPSRRAVSPTGNADHAARARARGPAGGDRHRGSVPARPGGRVPRDRRYPRRRDAARRPIARVRFNSAASYVAGRSGTIAIVISDDGSVDVFSA
jgi:hypothetical protein